jgi:hypothetical protein
MDGRFLKGALVPQGKQKCDNPDDERKWGSNEVTKDDRSLTQRIATSGLGKW